MVRNSVTKTVYKRIMNRIVIPLTKELITKYHAQNAFIIGSFTNRKLWLPGISDIDCIILSNQELYAKYEKDVEIGKYASGMEYDEITEYIGDKIKVSCSVWKKELFLKENGWEEYLKLNCTEGTSIIEDQLLFSANRIRIWGVEKDFSIQIKPENYRCYLSKLFKDKNQRIAGIDLLSEIKRIIYACRIFHYLWTGKYLYDIEQLINESILGEEITEVLNYAYEMKRKIRVDELNMSDSGYFKNTYRFYSLRKRIINQLIEKDEGKGIPLNPNFVDLY